MHIRKPMFVVMLLAMNGLAVGAAGAGPIERACLASDREAVTPALCACIQAIADQTLVRKEQRLAAGFFADPQRAQEIRQSDNPRHEAFWKRYSYFAEVADSSCTVDG